MYRKALILSITLLALATSGYAQQSSYQNHAAIYQAVKNYIANNIKTALEYEFSITPLDIRLQLPECSNHLEAFNPDSQPIRAGRLSIGVRCNQTEAWSIFTSVQVKMFDKVLVLSQPVQPGQLITRQHLSSEKRDTADLRFGYLKRIDYVENKQATRFLAAGTVLHQGLIAEPALIKRGEKITISAVSPRYDIRMQGIAMMDGVKGQSIEVKNISSGRTVAGKVVEPGLVSVMY